MKYLLSLLAAALSVEAHGFIKLFTIDGTEYPAFNPIADRDAKAVKRIEWSWTNHSTVGVGPVLDAQSPAVACRSNPIAPQLSAPIRAGANITMKWTNYFTSHKGPVITYAGKYKAGQSINEVKWFKLAEDSYDPKTGKYGTDKLMANNHTINVQIPSNLEAGTYVVRNEIISLHFALRGSADASGIPLNGAEIYPVCFNIDVQGDGKVSPPTAGTFPGIYHRNDPGILTNIYSGPNRYVSPGPTVWQGEHNPPKGSAPTVKDTGYPADPAEKARFITAQKNGERVFEQIVSGFNTVFPGGGGTKDAADGNPALTNGPINGGRGYPLANVPKDGSLVGVQPAFATGGAGLALGKIPNNGVRPPPAAPKASAMFRA